MQPPLLLIRPGPDSERFAALWRARTGPDAPVVISPVTGIRPHPVMFRADGGEAAVFTSSNGVAAVTPEGGSPIAWCVGKRTTEAARAAGFDARMGGPDADALVSSILRSGRSGAMVHFRGAEAQGEVAARLSRGGVPCREVVVYEQETLPLSPQARNLLAGSGPVLVPLFSPNSARRLVAALQGGWLGASLRVAALSPAVAEAWDVSLADVRVIAERPDAAAMLDALTHLADSP